MKHLRTKLLLSTSLMVAVSVAPLAAVTEHSEPQRVDGVTCATPPVKPAKKDSTTKPKKQKSKKDSKKKESKKQKKDKSSQTAQSAIRN